ncbi:MAG: hypothetical protein COT55_01795 [Candidatus Diapherotrites archaeon CG09_land_8_20_14_0_10_32_12]|nr:MAG: hypothetical protein COT55_01795 [Candidatus Diapherotrites archaeon CG09_land_8_20_14_0_10_32_12]
MAYMKRNVNFGFFFLLIATLISLAGLSIYYQTTFKDLYMDYKLKLDDLRNISSTLSTEKAKLEQTSQELNIKEEREKELSTQYTGLKTEKEKLEDEKASLQKQLAAKTSELTQKRAELATAQAELSISKTELNAAMATISGLRADISNLDQEIAGLNAQLATCTCP